MWEGSLIVPQSFKNEEGIYENDVIKFITTENIGSNVNKYCKKNDTVGIKGRLTSKDGTRLIFVAEKITFLSSTKKGD